MPQIKIPPVFLLVCLFNLVFALPQNFTVGKSGYAFAAELDSGEPNRVAVFDKDREIYRLKEAPLVFNLEQNNLLLQSEQAPIKNIYLYYGFYVDQLTAYISDSFIYYQPKRSSISILPVYAGCKFFVLENVYLGLEIDKPLILPGSAEQAPQRFCGYDIRDSETNAGLRVGLFCSNELVVELAATTYLIKAHYTGDYEPDQPHPKLQDADKTFHIPRAYLAIGILL